MKNIIILTKYLNIEWLQAKLISWRGRRESSWWHGPGGAGPVWLLRNVQGCGQKIWGWGEGEGANYKFSIRKFNAMPAHSLCPGVNVK
jgi:hypothetical protein